MMSDFQARSLDWDDLGPDEDHDQNQALLLAQYHGVFDEKPRIEPIRRKKPRREESNWG